MAKTAATKTDASNMTVAPLFAEISPIVHADDIGEIRIFRAVIRGGNAKRGKQVNFADDEYVEANEGEEFEPSPFETTELEVGKILQEARPGLYWAQAYDKSGVIIHRAGRVIDASIDEPEGEPEADPAAPTDVNSVMVKEFMGMIREKDRRQQREPQSAIDMGIKLAGALNTREDPNAIIETLRDEIKHLRNSHETDIAEVRRKAGIETDEARRAANIAIDEARGDKRREVDLVTDRLRKAEERYDRDRDGWVNERRSIDDRHAAELRTVRESSDRALSELRVHTSQQIHTLEAKNMDLNAKYNSEILRAERNLMTTELDKRLAEREVADANNVIQNIQTQAEEMQKRIDASGGGGTISQLIEAAPAAERLIGLFRGPSGEKGKMSLTDIVGAIAQNPGIIEELRKDPKMMAQVQEMFGAPAQGQGARGQQQQEPPAQQWAQNADAQAQAAMEQQQRVEAAAAAAAAEAAAAEAAEAVRRERMAEAEKRRQAATKVATPPPAPPPAEETEEEEEEEEEEEDGPRNDEEGEATEEEEEGDKK